MGNFSTRMEAFTSDIKTSWYFRIYLFAWIILACTAFASLIVFAQRSAADGAISPVVVSVANVSSIQFPSFTIRTNQDELQNKLIGVSCYFQGTSRQFLETPPCMNVPEQSCVSVKAAVATAVPNYNAIYCSVSMTAPGTADKTLVISFDDETSYGGVTYVQPNNHAVLLLEEFVVDDTDDDDDTPNVKWNSDVVYQSTVVNGSNFQLTVLINSFAVISFAKSDGFDPWQSAAAIGGFSFLMYVLQSIFMMLVGCIIAPESKFLGYGNTPSGSGTSTYTNL